MIATTAQIDAMSDEQFVAYFRRAMREHAGFDDAGRAQVMRLSNPRNNRVIRAVVFERFGPAPVPTMGGEHPQFDEVL